MYAPARTHRKLHSSKLRNSLTALFAVAAVAGLGLFGAEPLPSQAALAVAAPAEIADVVVADAVATISVQQAEGAIGIDAQMAPDARDADIPPSQAKHKQPRRSRQSLAMPFFSFAARS